MVVRLYESRREVYLAKDDAKADPRELHYNVTKHTPTLLPKHDRSRNVIQLDFILFVILLRV